MKNIIIILLAVLPMTAYAADCRLYQHAITPYLEHTEATREFKFPRETIRVSNGGSHTFEATTKTAIVPINTIGLEGDFCVFSNEGMDLFVSIDVNRRSEAYDYLKITPRSFQDDTFRVGVKIILD